MAALAIVEVDTVIGRLLAHRDDEVITASLLRWNVWEPAETHFLRSVLRPGDTFVDVGANIGYFSVLGAACVGDDGTVIAVEPEARNAELLRANLARHGRSAATVLEVAAYSTTGWMRLTLREANRGDHRLSPTGTTGPVVRSVRLDDVLPDVVHAIKIDTQGFDHDVLAGSARTVAANPDLLVVAELSLRELEGRGIDPGSVLAGYGELGFCLAVLDDSGVPRQVDAADLLSECAARALDEVTLILRR